MIRETERLVLALVAEELKDCQGGVSFSRTYEMPPHEVRIDVVIDVKENPPITLSEKKNTKKK